MTPTQDHRSSAGAPCEGTPADERHAPPSPAPVGEGGAQTGGPSVSGVGLPTTTSGPANILGKGPAGPLVPRPKKRRPKDIGTAAETAVVRYLRTAGFPAAERRALKGSLDEGDITGTPGVCWEVKARNRPVSDAQIITWLDETATERNNAGADVGVLVIRRAGVGPARAGSWWAVLPAYQVIALGMDVHSHTRRPADLAFPVRLLLSDAVRLLRLAGYGDPFEESDR